MATPVEALCEVFGLLNTGNLVGAQASVLAHESGKCALPSSVFEHVLMAAVKADELLPEYESFCRNSYGHQVYQQIVAQAQVAANRQSGVRRRAS
jgi:hypothetical protein